MVAVSVAYRVGWYLAPALIGLALGVWYAKRGWPRNNDPRWRTWVRAGIGVIVALYVFGQAAAIAAQNEPSKPPIRTASPLDTWSSKYLLPELTLIAGDTQALNQAEAKRSWVGINNACFKGQAALDSTVGKPPAPNARVRVQYHAWVVNEYDLFTYCFKASTTQAQWLSSSGAADWSKAMTYVPASDAAYLKLAKLYKQLKQ